MDTEDSYHLALGRFIDQYATNEAVTQCLLSLEAGITAPAAQAVFSGTRTRTALGFIRRLYDATSRTLDHNLDRAMSHLVAITTVRDRIAHWGMRPMGERGFIVSNMMVAHTPKHLREFPISSDHLEAMRQDLVTIQTIMSLRLTDWSPEGLETERGKQFLKLSTNLSIAGAVKK